MKIRYGPCGIHLFSRDSGLNVLLDEQVPPRETWAKAPRHVSVALTNACDLSCSYCFAPKTPLALPYAALVGWLRELDEHGTLGVGFGGGEPTLFPQFARLCAEVAQTTGLAVSFTSHGHHLKRSLLDELKGHVSFIRLSMDGVGETYSRLRGRPFSEFVNVVDRVAGNIPFGINFVVNARTVGDLDRAAEFAVAHGAAEMLLLPEVSVGGTGGIDDASKKRFHEWVIARKHPIRLTVSEDAAEGLPTCDPLAQEKGLAAFAHIDAAGCLKATSYDSQGKRIGPDGVMRALEELKQAKEEVVA